MSSVLSAVGIRSVTFDQWTMIVLTVIIAAR